METAFGISKEDGCRKKNDGVQKETPPKI